MAPPKKKIKSTKAKAKAKAQSKKKSAKAIQNARARRFLFMLLGATIAAIIFLPTTVLLMVGMLPTAVAYVVDNTKRKLLGVIVGLMNLAGCIPFILKLWVKGHNMMMVTDIMQDPLTIVIIYAAAGVGYLIDWVVTDMAAAFIVKRARARLKAIEKQQRKFVERWGVTVNPYVTAEGADIGEDSDEASLENLEEVPHEIPQDAPQEN